MSKTDQKFIYSGGLNLVSLVYAGIILMKIAGTISWSWWWITLPFWGGFVVFLILTFIYIILSIISFIIKRFIK